LEAGFVDCGKLGVVCGGSRESSSSWLLRLRLLGFYERILHARDVITTTTVDSHWQNKILKITGENIAKFKT
jgi:hypothetical protein